MKLLSYRLNGAESFGAVVGDGVVDLRARLGGRFATLGDLLRADALTAAEAALRGATPDVALADIAYLPTITDPSRILAIGVNYREHAQETGQQRSAEFPSVFLRLIDTVVGHNEAILRPRVSDNLDFEGELAVVVGRAGRYIRREDALGHVAGYACFNDASIRDWQRHNPGPTPGKNFYRCGSFGPWLVTADELPDPSKLELTTTLNGATVQHTTTDMLIHDVPRIIEYCSGFTPLLPGDVISTGTPSGVGMSRQPPLWMKAGDVVEVTISSIGTLRNTIEDEG